MLLAGCKKTSFHRLIEPLLQIGRLNDLLDDYLRPPNFKAFLNKDKELMFSEEERLAFSSCLGSLVAVPVEGYQGEQHPRYVLECDIVPHGKICQVGLFLLIEDI